MTSHNGIIHQLQLDHKGGAVTLSPTELTGASTTIQWRHYDGNHDAILEHITDTANGIDEQSANALVDKNVRPRTFIVDDSALIILRGVNHNEGEDAANMISIRLWVTQNQIISLSYQPLKSIDDIVTLLAQGCGPKTIGEILTALASRLFEHIEPALLKLNDQIDDIEEHVIDKPDIHLRQNIADIRKQAILFRRYIAPQKEAIGQLRLRPTSWLEEQHGRRLQENYDTVIRYIEDLDAIRERAQIVKDELANSLSDKLNRNLYILSVITAIFLPLGFLTGLFGINVGGMPGTDNTSAFYLFTLSLALIVSIQIILFKWLKWF